MVNFGFVFGFLLGIPVAVIDHAFGIWWLLPFMGVIVGWTTNLLGHGADLRAGRRRKRVLGVSCTGCSCAARPASPTSTPGSSPTT